MVKDSKGRVYLAFEFCVDPCRLEKRPVGPTKAERHEAIRERARNAIRDLYHNATPTYPDPSDGDPYLDPDGEEFWDWFQRAAQFELEYVQGGGAYGSVTNAVYQTGRGKSLPYKAMARRRVRRQIKLERSRCNRNDSREGPVDAMWEYASDWYGKLYQWGRGGRTLAPEDLVREGGGSNFSVDEDYPDDLSIEDCVDLIKVIESFNAYVASWCKSIPELWADEVEQQEVMLAECGGQ